MEHVIFVQKVREDKKEEYVKVHKEAWKELLLETKKAGFERQILWLLDNNVLIYSMVENFDEAISKLKKTDTFKKWQAKMEELLEEAQDFSEEGTVIRLEKIYDLEEQLNQ
ncbi:MAG: L-rhamnose mutarotase [Candidatus Humimicrobiaceae bacterium]